MIKTKKYYLLEKLSKSNIIVCIIMSVHYSYDCVNEYMYCKLPMKKNRVTQK